MFRNVRKTRVARREMQRGRAGGTRDGSTSTSPRAGCRAGKMHNRRRGEGWGDCSAPAERRFQSKAGEGVGDTSGVARGAVVTGRRATAAAAGDRKGGGGGVRCRGSVGGKCGEPGEAGAAERVSWRAAKHQHTPQAGGCEAVFAGRRAAPGRALGPRRRCRRAERAYGSSTAKRAPLRAQSTHHRRRRAT